MRTFLFLALMAVCESVHAQPACPGIALRTSSSSDLRPSSSSRIRLIRQSDGRYTGYEIADVAPHRILQTIADFQTRTTPCGPWAFSQDPFDLPPEASARLADGRYLFVTAPVRAGIHAALFDASMNLLAEADTPATGDTVALSLTDLDGDGKLDVVASTALGRVSGVAVYRGLGGVSFQSPAVFGDALFYHTFGMGTGDLDGDGKPDVLVSADTTLHVLYGTGDGALEPPVALAPVIQASFAIADLNRDGKPDLVFAAGSRRDYLNVPYVAVAFGRGNRTFADPVKYLAIGSEATAIGDVDGDGNLDIVTSGVTVLYGDGAGAFPRRRNYWNGTRGEIIFADFDRDGKTDIVIGRGTPQAISGDRVTVFFNRGEEFTGAPARRIDGSDSSSFGALSADFNRDGVPDLAVADLSQVFVFLGARTGVFTTGFRSAIRYARIAQGDFNGDGFPDLVAIDAPDNGASLVLFLGRGNGDFFAPFHLPLPSRNAIGPVTGDFDGDGRLDVAVLVNDLLVYPGDGRGGLGAPASYSVNAQVGAIAAGDFNGDGRADLAISALGTSGITLFLSRPGAGLSRVPIATSAEASTLVAADFNHDGRADLVAQVGNGRAGVLLARPDGSLVESGFLTGTDQTGQLGFSGFVPADLDGDGSVDVVDWGDTSPAVFLGNGDGLFRQAIALPRLFGTWLAADVDGDGLADLISVTEGGIATWLNTSRPPPPFTVVSSAGVASGAVAPDSLATIFGSRFASATVSIRDSAGAVHPAQILYTTDTQINFVVPAGTAPGDAVVTVTTPSGVRNATVTIAAVAPGVFSWDATGFAAVWITRIAADGTRTDKPGGLDPIDLGPSGDRVYLSFYGTGIHGARDVRLEIQGVNAGVLYAGSQRVTPGLDQVSVLLPRELAGAGLASVFLTADGVISNRVYLNFR